MKNIEYNSWEGLEVEGRYFGLHTLFLDGDVDFKKVKLNDNIQHIYFTSKAIESLNLRWDEFVKWNLEFNVPKRPITFEIYDGQFDTIPSRLRNHIHFMLKVTLSDFRKLKSTDTFKIDEKDNLYNNFNATKYNFQEVRNEDYSIDFNHK